MLTARNPFWAEPIKAHLSKPLFSGEDHSNLTFICGNGEIVTWNGLAYLGSLSKLFKPRSEEEQRFTIILPGYPAQAVRSLLMLLATGETTLGYDDVSRLEELAKDLGVRLTM